MQPWRNRLSKSTSRSWSTGPRPSSWVTVRPVIQVKDPQGKGRHDAPTVFLPVDGNFTSNGIIKMPDNDPQLAFQAIFHSDNCADANHGPLLNIPGRKRSWRLPVSVEGNLGLDNGVPQSVYKRYDQPEEAGAEGLRPGEAGRCRRTRNRDFTGVKEYGTFDVAHDPGKEFALIAAILAIAGLSLSLFIRAVGVWVR